MRQRLTTDDQKWFVAALVTAQQVASGSPSANLPASVTNLLVFVLLIGMGAISGSALIIAGVSGLYFATLSSTINTRGDQKL